MRKNYLVFFILALFFVGLGVYSNTLEQNSKDRSKLPPKVEDSRSFQRWITNLRNKDLVLEADDFRMIEEVEVYNTKWLKVNSIDEKGLRESFESTIEAHKNTDKIMFSPSEREFIDFRNIERDGYRTNEVRFYGQKEDKVLDMRALDCSTRSNCYFDRGYFLSNDLFVVTEISRNVDKKNPDVQPCAPAELCTYTFKLHLLDLINNSRLVYESKSFEVVLAELIPEL